MPQDGELLWYTVWIGVIGVGAMLIGVLASRAIRKRLRGGSTTETFTVQDLREMRNGGEITQQEYEAMRAAIIGRLASDSPTPANKNAPRQPAREPEAENDTRGAGFDSAPDDKQ